MALTRPPSLSPEDMQKIIEAVSRRGASVTMADPRLSALQNWLMVTIGTVLIVVGGWTITSINRLNETMVKVVEQNTALQRVNDAQDRRFDNLDRRIESLDMRLRDEERKP
jgi:ethanolamine utilization microcompartment shell protein EutL